jgi:hypothetical protein
LDAEDAIFDEAGVVADAESAGTAGGFFFFGFFSSFGVFVAFAGSAIEIFSDDPAATTFGGASDWIGIFFLTSTSSESEEEESEDEDDDDDETSETSMKGQD